MTMHACILVYMVAMVVREFIYSSMQKLDTEYHGTVSWMGVWACVKRWDKMPQVRSG